MINGTTKSDIHLRIQMADSRVHNQFKLITTDEPVIGDVGDDVILPCHISPETSSVTMTIRWFRETECIYLYNNGQVTERTGYEDRLSLNTQELERGNVSEDEEHQGVRWRSLHLSGHQWRTEGGGCIMVMHQRK
ncbi:hypothetical protein UPYG_G00301450 [Umbra pygmaea]|uniref:Immunoglobulin V-set domain-containing protein n=1 Tax=Umbra pygmaea TaxID=75934 RepID=A0ABD0WB63_UMBPY